MFLKYSINVNMYIIGMHWEHIYQVTPMPFFFTSAQLEVMSSPPSVIFFALHDNFQKNYRRRRKPKPRARAWKTGLTMCRTIANLMDDLVDQLGWTEVRPQSKDRRPGEIEIRNEKAPRETQTLRARSSPPHRRTESTMAVVRQSQNPPPPPPQTPSRGA